MPVPSSTWELALNLIVIIIIYSLLGKQNINIETKIMNKKWI